MNVSEALNLLKDKGYRYTGKRETMVRAFARENRYMSAKEILKLMQKDYPQLSFDTVYRNLSLFEELGILEVTEFKGERLYSLSCPESHHHHHIICTVCGKTQKLDLCPMSSIFGTPPGFNITGHKFEIYGQCEACSNKGVPHTHQP
ncbi:Fur family transcriptional regulator [Aneurinibacillus terranovensis]|uniref:Fur family transcriptional regulator n=1 Tax=Aneurinibacillus terranovensis TaxID=278991 RepID=UPI0004210107|nr:Fur family transcriptional regulator [Aneurinibacillus terranovensis]